MKPRSRSVLSGCALLFSLLAPVSCRQSRSTALAHPPIVDLTSGHDLHAVTETRQIIFGAGDRSRLLDGWSFDEHDASGSTFVWAVEPEASVSFEVLEVVEQQFLVKLSAFPGATPQAITVRVNGELVSSFSAKPTFLEYRFVVPAHLLHRGENRLTFRHDRLGTSAAEGETRRFAAAYSSILIGPQCLPLRAWGLPPPPHVRLARGRRSMPAPLVVTGPAVISRRLRIPLQGVLRYHVSLVAPARGPANATLRIREGDASRDVVETRLVPWFFNGSPARNVEVDLTPWRGKPVDLEIEVEPDTCRTTVTTVVIEHAGIYAVDGDGTSR
jgi:hypothetical protein